MHTFMLSTYYNLTLTLISVWIELRCLFLASWHTDPHPLLLLWCSAPFSQIESCFVNKKEINRCPAVCRTRPPCIKVRLPLLPKTPHTPKNDNNEPRISVTCYTSTGALTLLTFCHPSLIDHLHLHYDQRSRIPLYPLKTCISSPTWRFSIYNSLLVLTL